MKRPNDIIGYLATVVWNEENFDISAENAKALFNYIKSLESTQSPLTDAEIEEILTELCYSGHLDNRITIDEARKILARDRTVDE